MLGGGGVPLRAPLKDLSIGAFEGYSEPQKVGTSI